MKKRFKNANEAYEAVLDEILQNGIDFGDTKAIFNCGFYIDNPSDKAITNTERNWSQNYASAEWYWYLSGDPSVDKLSELYGRVPPICLEIFFIIRVYFFLFLLSHYSQGMGSLSFIASCGIKQPDFGSHLKCASAPFSPRF